jgi:hypothetical protein
MTFIKQNWGSTAIMWDCYSTIERPRWSRGSVLAFGTQVCGFAPGQSHQIFRAKISSARLPSEEKYSRRSHVIALQHVRDP